MKIISISLLIGFLVITPVFLVVFHLLRASSTQELKPSTPEQVKRRKRFIYIASSIYGIVLLSVFGFFFIEVIAPALNLNVNLSTDNKGYIVIGVTNFVGLIVPIMYFAWRLPRWKPPVPPRLTSRSLEWENRVDDIFFRKFRWWILQSTAFMFIMICIGILVAYFIT